MQPSTEFFFRLRLDITRHIEPRINDLLLKVPKELPPLVRTL